MYTDNPDEITGCAKARLREAHHPRRGHLHRRSGDHLPRLQRPIAGGRTTSTHPSDPTTPRSPSGLPPAAARWNIGGVQAVVGYSRYALNVNPGG